MANIFLRKFFRGAMTFVLLVGIFGAGLTTSFNLSAANAQTIFDESVQETNNIQFVKDEYSLGKVVEIVQIGQRVVEEFVQNYQVSRIELQNGDERGKKVDVEHSEFTSSGQKKVDVGDTVVMVKITSGDEVNYFIADDYRLPALALVFGIFLLMTFIFGRKKGFTSLLGLGVSIAVIMLYVVPSIAAGANPLLVSLAGALVVMLASMYLAHGFALRTTVALVATMITFGLAIGLSYAFVTIGKLYGLGSDEAMFLQLGSIEGLNLQGLLLGGILFGTLGVLDDITTAQTAIVEELKFANPTFGLKELYKRGISVGREHISSLVNTLFLAYAGASLPLFLLFTTSGTQPWWVIMNGEIVAEEVVRTLVGSTVLVLAVPITTLLAAIVMANRIVPADKAGKPITAPHHH